jgi:hypothetical protein
MTTVADETGATGAAPPVIGSRSITSHEAPVIPAGISRPELGLVQGEELFADPTTSANALAVAVNWLREDHGPGLGRIVVGPKEIARWVDRPLDLLLPSITSRKARAGVASVRQRLTADLHGRVVTVADLHGEVHPGRWWFDASLARVAAVDAWDPVQRGLPDVDLIQLVIATRILGATSEPGTAAVGDLLTSGWSQDETEVLGAGWNANVALRPSTPVLLAWLQSSSEIDGPSANGGDRAEVLHDVSVLFEQLAPNGLLNSPSIDEVLQPEALDADEPSAERARTAVAAALVRSVRRRRSRTSARRTLLGMSLAAVLWVGGTYHLDVSAMTDTGLLSILRPAAYLSLAVLLGCFCAEMASPRPATWRLAAPVVGLVTAIHGTPALLYGTLRYSWAWKHLGIIDFIHRHGEVDPAVHTLGVYHNWPGFFALNSAWTDLFGLSGSAPYARWWPLLANLAAIPALLYVFRGLRGGANRRTSWLAIMIFFVSNWIGQDYFSPQSLSFLLYLVVIGVVLQFTGTELRETSRIGGTWPRRWSVAVALLASAAIITSHQVTPMVLLLSLVALSVTRQARAAKIAGGVVLLALVWSTTGAWDFLSGNVASLVEGLGQPVANADQNLVDQTRLSSGQALVSNMGRVTLVIVALLAVWGIVRELRRRRVDGAGLALLAAPGMLLFANTFGGEIVFRSYLFALPLLSWYAALALWPAIDTAGRAVSQRQATVRGAVAVMLTGALLAGFLFGYYGKDAYYTFSRHEIAASAYVLDHAPPRTLLVTVTANYPGQWENYERLTYVPIASEPASTWRRVAKDPVGVMSGWLSGSEYADGYILLTRSQEREVESTGVLPPGSIARFRRALETSPRFRTVYASPEAQVFQLAPTAHGR